MQPLEQSSWNMSDSILPSETKEGLVPKINWSLLKEFITGSCRFCGGNSRERNHSNGCF